MASTSRAGQYINEDTNNNINTKTELQMPAHIWVFEKSSVRKILLLMNILYSMSSVVLIIFWLAFYFKLTLNEEDDNYLVIVKSISAFDTLNHHAKVTNSTHHGACNHILSELNPWSMIFLMAYISLGTTLAIGNLVRYRITGLPTCIRAIITITTTAIVSSIILPEFIMPCHESPRNFQHPNVMIFICFSVVIIVVYSLCPVGRFMNNELNTNRTSGRNLNDELQQDPID